MRISALANGVISKEVCMAVSRQRELKQQIIESVKEKIKKAKSVVLIEYKGLNVNEDTQLRNDFRKNGVEYKVLKNTLIKKAFNELDHTEFDPKLNGTTSVAFSYKDEVAAAKVVSENAKKFTDKLNVKCGYLSGMFIEADKVKELAALPGKEILVSKMMGSLNAPISGFVGVLSATMRSLVYALKALEEKKAQA
jgi:large subunit ribosomal protein L10